jgi:hypothetical protein
MWRQLGLDSGIDANWDRALVWGGLGAGTRTRPGDALFPRVEL